MTTIFLFIILNFIRREDDEKAEVKKTRKRGEEMIAREFSRRRVANFIKSSKTQSTKL